VTVVGHPVEGSAGGEAAEKPTTDPLIVSDRSFRRTFLSMARTGLFAVGIGIAVVAFGIVVLLV